MFTPDYMFNTVYDIPDEVFTKNGIRYLFCDIDNTLAPYECDVPTTENLKWFEKIKGMGIKIYFISNKKIAKPADELAVGDVVKVKITAIDFEAKKVSLSIRALLEPETAEEVVAEEEAEETVAE